MEISKHQPYPSTTKYLSLYHKIFFASSFDSLNCRPPTDVKDRASMLVIIFSTGTQQISSQLGHLYDLSTGYHHMCKVQNERF